MTRDQHRTEVEEGERFEFGKNWTAFLTKLNDRRITEAEISLRRFFARENFEGIRFLDLGCGSGLFSLAARRLGATVCSVDFDPQCVRCALSLKTRYFAEDPGWTVVEGSVLNSQFLASLGTFDIVYSWGVLHHTGEMWEAIRNAAGRVELQGSLLISIYNDQGRASVLWTRIKRLYNQLPASLRWTVVGPCALRLWGPTTLRDFLAGRPFHTWRTYDNNRGMSAWDDLIDWVGGYPFQVAKPEQIFEFVRELGFSLERMKTCAGGIGCNEYLFIRQKRQASLN